MNLALASFGFGLITASILALAAVGFTMQFGITNILNLSYGNVMTSAAFVAYYFNHLGVDIWICLVIGAAFGGIFSLLLNRALFVPFARVGTKPFGMVIVTLAVGLMIQNLILAIGGPNFFSYQMSLGPTVAVGPIELTLSQIGIMVIAVLAMIGLHLLLTTTKFGKAMRATAAQPFLARACGITTRRMIDIAWALSGALCGMAGVALVMNTTTFQSTTGNDFLVVIIAAAMVGGVGQPYGAMAGALLIGLVTEVSAAFMDPAYKNVIAFLILVLVLILRPQGFLGRVMSGEREIAT